MSWTLPEDWSDLRVSDGHFVKGGDVLFCLGRSPHGHGQVLKFFNIVDQQDLGDWNFCEKEEQEIEVREGVFF
jgi:hypothetical protein